MMYWEDILAITSAVYAGVSLTTIKVLIGVNFHHSRKLRKKLAQRLLKDKEFDALVAKKIEIERLLEKDRALKKKDETDL